MHDDHDDDVMCVACVDHAHNLIWQKLKKTYFCGIRRNTHVIHGVCVLIIMDMCIDA